MPAVYDVVEDADPQQSASVRDSLREFPVLRARSRITGRVIVQKDAATLPSSTPAWKTSRGCTSAAVAVPIDSTECAIGR